MPRKPSSSLRSSDLEAALFFQIKAAGLPLPVQQYRWCPGRRYRADFAYPEPPEKKLLIEVQGGIWIAGRHNRASGYEADLERANLATLHGWRLLQFTAGMIESGLALGMIEQALSIAPKELFD